MSDKIPFRWRPFSMRVVRLLVLGYGLVVCLASMWAWWIDVTMLNSGQEHWLPNVILVYVGAPTSLLLDAVMPVSAPVLVGLAFLTICAAAQFAFLWWVVRKRGRGNARA